MRAHDEAARSGLAADPRVRLVRGNFEVLGQLLLQEGVTKVDGLLADFGVSSMQLDEPGRGFSFRRDEPLRMVMDQSADQNAQEWLNTVDEKELADVIYRYGEERASRRIAAALVAARPLSTTGQLAEVVCAARRRWPRVGQRHPATQVFQAVRIAINRELAVIERLLEQLPDLMADGGGVYRSIVEHWLVGRRSVSQPTTTVPCRRTSRADSCPRSERLTRKAVQASDEERQRNSRARSAQLRVVRRLEAP